MSLEEATRRGTGWELLKALKECLERLRE